MPRARASRIVALLPFAGLVLLVGLPGCGDDLTLPEPVYRPADTPENVVLNLMDAYRRREVEPYQSLLHPDFRFHLQPEDVRQLEVEYLTRDWDMAGTEGLFASGTINDLEVDLVLSEPEESAGAGIPEGAVRIRAEPTLLNVNRTDGVTLQVDDPQEFVLVPDPDDGEKWVLYAWFDHGPPLGKPAAGESAAVEVARWGQLKAGFIPEGRGPDGYRPLDKPEHVVHNLEVCYREREFGPYVDLLHPEFRFRFQPGDAEDYGQDHLSRDADFVGTQAMFTADFVESIDIELVHAAAQPATEIDLPPGTVKIRVVQALLNVNQSNGTTYQIVDPQDFFLRPNPTDSEEWQIYEWHDIRGGQGAPVPVERTSWGRLKILFAG